MYGVGTEALYRHVPCSGEGGGGLYSEVACPKARLHVPSPSLCPSLSPSKYNIMPMVMVCLMGRMGTEPILSIKRSVSIDTMINFDSDGDGHGDGDGTCKQASKGACTLRFHVQGGWVCQWAGLGVALYSEVQYIMGNGYMDPTRWTE